MVGHPGALVRWLVLAVTIVAFGLAVALLGIGRRRKPRRSRRKTLPGSTAANASRSAKSRADASSAKPAKPAKPATPAPSRGLSRAAPRPRPSSVTAATDPEPRRQPAPGSAPAPGAANADGDADDPTTVSGPPELPDENEGDDGGVGDIEPTVVTRRFTIQVPESELAAADDDLPWVPSARSELTNPTMPFALILVTAVGQTDVGRKREGNEDSYLVLPEHSLFAVADGLGGHAAGEVASALAVQTMGEAFRAQKFDGTPRQERARRGDELVRSIEMANRTVYKQSRRVKGQAGMGTTVVAARFAPNKKRVYIAHVGDSRCYRVRNSVLEMLTQDHTLEAHGVTGPRAGVLTRAVGQEPAVQVDLLNDTPEIDDQYLLCSDGLTKMVPDPVIREIMLRESDIERCVQALIEEANKRGGKDNITVIVVRIMGSISVPGAIIPVGR